MSTLHTNKQYGDAWVYSPMQCRTAALHAQPQHPDIRLDTCTAFTEDYSVFVDMRGALDAPNAIPSGGVRALDFIDAPGRLLIGHVYRAGWHS